MDVIFWYLFFGIFWVCGDGKGTTGGVGVSSGVGTGLDGLGVGKGWKVRSTSECWHAECRRGDDRRVVGCGRLGVGLDGSRRGAAGQQVE